MKSPFTYYWSTHKAFLIGMSIVIIACAITGFYTIQALFAIPVFILVLLSRTSRFNPEWEVAKLDFLIKEMTAKGLPVYRITKVHCLDPYFGQVKNGDILVGDIDDRFDESLQGEGYVQGYIGDRYFKVIKFIKLNENERGGDQLIPGANLS